MYLQAKWFVRTSEEGTREREREKGLHEAPHSLVELLHSVKRSKCLSKILKNSVQFELVLRNGRP